MYPSNQTQPYNQAQLYNPVQSYNQALPYRRAPQTTPSWNYDPYTNGVVPAPNAGNGPWETLVCAFDRRRARRRQNPSTRARLVLSRAAGAAGWQRWPAARNLQPAAQALLTARPTARWRRERSAARCRRKL